MSIVVVRWGNYGVKKEREVNANYSKPPHLVNKDTVIAERPSR